MMTHDEMIEIIQAAAEGKVIEYRNRRLGPYWYPVLLNKESFNFGIFEYRIKPVTHRGWVVMPRGKDKVRHARVYDSLTLSEVESAIKLRVGDNFRELVTITPLEWVE